MTTTNVAITNLVFHDIPRNIYDTITPVADQIYLVEENETIEQRIANTLNNYTPTNNFANVAFTGEYSDILNSPSIPAAQVQTDWNAVSGMGVILNKPTLGDMAFVNTVDYNDVTNTPTIPVIDATYNGQSSNAQSGIGIEGELTNRFVVVNALPASPSPNVFYFIVEE